MTNDIEAIKARALKGHHPWDGVILGVGGGGRAIVTAAPILISASGGSGPTFRKIEVVLPEDASPEVVATAIEQVREMFPDAAEVERLRDERDQALDEAEAATRDLLNGHFRR